MSRIKYNVNDLLYDIENTINGIGEDLTYTDIYDNIKEARFEEDDTLSQGVWTHDLQVPNWELVEELSVEAIKNKSKDLQIIGWLVESLVILDEFEGISNGIHILNEFIKKYWDNCYPLSQNKDANVDQKLRILEWIYETAYRRSNLIQIFGDNSFSIYNYEYAIAINNNILKNPKNKSQILESARKSNIKFIEDINTIIENIEQSEIDNLSNNIYNINNNIADLKTTLLEKTNNNRAFTKLIDNINTINRLISKRYHNNEQTKGNITDNNIETNSNEQIMNDTDTENNNNKQVETNVKSFDIKALNREEIYKLLNELYLLLKEVDKHSPSPYLLNLILEWKDKTLLDIINDVKTGNTESHQLLKMLLS